MFAIKELILHKELALLIIIYHVIQIFPIVFLKAKATIHNLTFKLCHGTCHLEWGSEIWVIPTLMAFEKDLGFSLPGFGLGDWKPLSCMWYVVLPGSACLLRSFYLDCEFVVVFMV